MDYNKLLNEDSAELVQMVFADDLEKKLRPVLEIIGLLRIKVFHLKLHSDSPNKENYIIELEDAMKHYIDLVPKLIKIELIPTPIVVHNTKK